MCDHQARYLLQEILASGGRLSTTKENVCYLNEGDIPKHIPAHLNDAIKTFSGDVTVTISNLNRYLNVYVGKYYDQNDGCHMPEPCQSLFLQEVEKETTSAEEAGCSMDVEMVIEPGQGGSKTPTKSVPVSPSRTVFTTPSVKHAESGSSGRTTTGSCFTPGKMPESDSEARLELEETDSALLDKYFVVQGRKLLELFNLGSSEGEAGNVCLKIHHGAIPLIEYVTKGPNPQIRTWEGQGKLGKGPKEKLFSGTSLACAAAITTGARWTKVNHWAKKMSLLLPSRTAFYKFFKRIRPAIETVYDRYEARTILDIKSAYENQRLEGWNIAIDGAYDSRGHSADFCKVLAVDLQTGLCVHTEVVYRKETGGKSGLMEKIGFHRILRWFRSMNIPLHSISTDRSYALKTEVDSYNAEYDAHIRWHVDPWHLSKCLDKNLRAVEKRKDCEAIHEWKDHIKAHLYHSIRRGAQTNRGEMMKFHFNTCLYHVAGIHQWRQNEQTGCITQCIHENLPDERGKAIVAWGSPSHERLKKVLLQQQFQKDIKLASPYGGTSQEMWEHRKTITT
ncbi:unnamed protein product [Cylicocyclus nassatus]|uniref:Uncharacterized protein n=1 Tax=Cylicocyclus nassatus TaxID=53992 RepID=A0AA36M1U0_CYLNA|nr:unnamed protein product [Cylicocyclus nassatus]